MSQSLRGTRSWNVALALGLVLALASRAVRADRIVLRGGGQVRGKLLPDPARKDRVTVLTETGKTPLSFERSKVAEVIAEPSALDGYLIEREKAGASAEAQYELGLWCERHKLGDLAELHYASALAQDKSFGPAHQKLGHVLYGERWLTTDELREAQGLVKYKGKWITREEKAEREAEASVTAEQASWVRRLRQLRQAVALGSERRAREAESQLLEIRDPVAVKPLMRVFSEDVDPLRVLLDRVLGVIPGPEAAAALVTRVLYEPVDDVRKTTFQQIEQRSEPNVLKLLVKALGSTNTAVVNRAAWTIAGLHAVSTVPDLIPALTTTQYNVVMSGGTSSGGMGASSVTPGVAPGGSLPSPTGALLSLGGGMSAPRGPVPRLVPVTYQNVEVRNALAQLTGEDFGYDVGVWKEWLRRSYRSQKDSVRRVPQP
ncbi:MAG: hypothetical protein P4L84_12520 [Isosphaeraceae bacterium]|nr:hypothetical protein [Isosphaeraceae bacterium]